MALIGANNEEKIWNYLKAKGLNDYGIAGCMGKNRSCYCRVFSYYADYWRALRAQRKSRSRVLEDPQILCTQKDREKRNEANADGG